MTQQRRTRAERQAELMAAEQQPEKREPSATERLEALAARRRANAGYLIPPPEPLTALNFRSWLHAVAEAGSPGDMELAWYRCENAQTKGELVNEYGALRDQAGRRWHAIEAAAEREREAERAAATRRAERVRIEGEIAGHEAAAASLRRKLAALER